MSQPTEYQRQYSFSAFQGLNPDDPLPAVKIELEFNAIKTTLDQIRTNLALIQRDDGELANSSVGTAQLEATLTTLGFDRPTSWATATAYAIDAAVFEANKLYFCLVAHTSGVFATDLSAAKWVMVVDFTDLVTDAEAAANAAAVSAAAASASAASAAAVVAAALPLAGGTMAGPIVTSGDATLATQAPRLSQVQSGVSRHATATAGTVDVIAITHSPPRTAWAAGMSGCFTAAGANTIAGASLNPDGIGAKTFLKNDLQALAVGDIAGAGHEVEWEYNGTNVIIKNPSSSNAYTVNGQTQETTPVPGDFIGGYDLSATAERKFSITNILKAINALTEDTTPDVTADFLLSYDTSAATVKKVKPSTTGSVPAGVVAMTASASTPSGWLPCDGAAVSRATYAALFTAISTAWGTGDGSTTFNVPNLSGRVAVGSGTGSIVETLAAANFNVSDVITVTSNSQEAGTVKWQTGMKVQVSTDGVLPTGISAATDYFVRRLSSTTISLYDTLAHAVDIGNNSSATTTGIVNITATGSGNHTITHTFQTRALGDTFGHELNNGVPRHSHETLGGSSGSGLAGVANQGGSSNRNDGTAKVGDTEGITNMPPSAVLNYIIKM